ILPPGLLQMLAFVDGERTTLEIQEAFSRYVGFPIDGGLVERTLAQLDSAYLLDNERSQQAVQALLDDYRAQTHRPPALAGLSYPADPAELTQSFIEFGEGDNLNGWPSWHGRGVISPHIDYHRGGPVYAQVWKRAAAAVQDTDLVLIFGTDHNGGLGKITLTEKAYATPFGVIPTEPELVRRLAEAVGPTAFDEEIHHRKEHSIELSAVWMHYTRQENPPPMIPILCGSFHHFVMNGSHPAEDPVLTRFVEALKRETAGRRVLAVASVDLAHVGPNFGDDFVMDGDRRAALAESDRSLMDAIRQGDAARFYREIAAVEDSNRICGFSSIYLMLRYLETSDGVKVAYEHCPADTADSSLVSICGMLLE
ncbi:MAG: AmmeMemoRadiSam system protein B, partial [Candidatus Promineifilaceae bacterium]